MLCQADEKRLVNPKHGSGMLRQCLKTAKSPSVHEVADCRLQTASKSSKTCRKKNKQKRPTASKKEQHLDAIGS